jgi:hypothetical protein
MEESSYERRGRRVLVPVDPRLAGWLSAIFLDRQAMLAGQNDRRPV